MKFKNFDVADVFGPNDTEEAKGYIGKLGYVEDDIDDLENAIAHSPEQMYKLVRIKQIDCDNKYVIGACGFKYFLPLEKVKKTEPVKKEVKYRPFKNLNEIQSALCGGDVTKYAFFDVGTHLTVRRKDERNREQVILTTSIEYKDGHLYLINHRRLDEWFNNFELLVNDAWGHFGIEVEEDE